MASESSGTKMLLVLLQVAAQLMRFHRFLSIHSTNEGNFSTNAARFITLPKKAPTKQTLCAEKTESLLRVY